MGIDNKTNNMSFCVGKSETGNFVMCRIEHILINAEYTKLFFLGHISEIIPYYESGVYERSRTDEN